MSSRSRQRASMFGAGVVRREETALAPQAIEPRPAEKPVDADELARRVLAGERAALARAISLIESTHPRHSRPAQELLGLILPRAGNAVRVGVTGVPGAGKSTFIEKLGLMLCEQGERVAVLAIDPSSTISGGSILGDRTRMGQLATHERAFIRPSPSGGSLGGVARRTRDASLVCEAAGFTTLLIETVGVGQSETVVADMVDCVLTLAITGSGDELQGVKRGLLEVVDVVAVNKADGDNIEHARRAATELAASLRVLRAGTPIPVIPCSARTGQGIDDVWDAVRARVESLRTTGGLDERRREQMRRWMHSLIDERLHDLLRRSHGAGLAIERAEAGVRDATLTPDAAAALVIDALVHDIEQRGTA